MHVPASSWGTSGAGRRRARTPARILAHALAALALASGVAQAEVYRLTPADDWLGVLNGEGLAPGDTVLLASGTYTTPDDVLLNLGHVGTPAAPITIRADAGATPVITRNTFGAFDDYFTNLHHNVINLRGAQYVILDGLEITGGNWGIRIGNKTSGLNADPYTRPMGDTIREARNITVRNCHIHHTHNTAISANFPGEVYDGLVFRHNEVSHSGRYGEAFYLGNYGAATNGGAEMTLGIVRNSVVEGNYIHDQVWINSWYQDPNPLAPSYHGTGIQLKDGCYNNLVSDNVIHYTRYPGILISGAESSFGARGTPGWGPNVIRRNIVWQISKAASDITGQGFQIAADADVVNNIVYAPQPFFNSNHQTLSGNLTIRNNTFISSTGGETMKFNNSPTYPILVANNALYRGAGNTNVITGAGSGSTNIVRSGNVAITNLTAALQNPAGLDFYPAVNSPLLAVADLSRQATDDFNGSLRRGDRTVGAYAYRASGNPGWIVVEGFKTVADTSPRTVVILR